MSMDLTEASHTSEKVYKLLNYNYSHSEMVTMAVFDWAISWSTLKAWSTFRIRLVLYVTPWSTKDVRRNACDIFRS